MPKVSIVLPVYNGEAYLRESIQSILKQRFTNFELVIINDGSTDESEGVISSISDQRVRCFTIPANSGTAHAMNLGYQHATGEYIAHMDADDVAVPDRLGKQVEFLDRAPDISILGGQMQAFGATRETLLAPRKDPFIKANFLGGVANIYNPTAMFRRELLCTGALKCDVELLGAFDWGFWVEAMLIGARFENLPDPLVRYRIHETQQSKDQSTIRPALARVRTRVMSAFFSTMSHNEITALEPLLQWTRPPQISVSDLEVGMTLIHKAMACGQSPYGENQEQIKGYLQACERRWRSALSSNGGSLR
jgi:glycosyltransferase involved in cell wall biosynthesis